MAQSGKKTGSGRKAGVSAGAKTGKSGQKAKKAASVNGTDTVRQRVIDETLRLIAEKGWRQTKQQDVIAAAGISDIAFVREFDSLLSVLVAASRQLNAAMLEAKTDFGADDTVRDRLFSLLMARVDAATSWQPAIKELAKSAPYDPVLAATAGKIMMTVATQALSAVGIRTTGPLGFARVNAFIAGVMLPVACSWLHDDSESLDKTMVTLDRALDRAEWLAGRLRPSSCVPKRSERRQAQADMPVSG